MQFYETISDYNQRHGLPPLKHPHLFVHSHHRPAQCKSSKSKATSQFYTLFFKRIISGRLKYGLTEYSSDKGVMMFIAPHQVVEVEELSYEAQVFIVAFEEAFIAGTPLYERVKQASPFFSYDTHEALILTPSEEDRMIRLLETLEAEYQTPADEHSQGILQAHLDTLLKYADRFYARQYDTQNTQSAVLSQLQSVLNQFSLETQGIPNVEQLAQELEMSPRALSDTLKKETGKTALEHVHFFLIGEAKHLLVDPQLNIQSVAYKLGFESPHYFSRLFKDKVGLSPLHYRKQVLEKHKGP